jgi:hypothetical protein
MPAQTFKNHGRVVPAYHAGVFFPFLANFFWSSYRLWRGVNGDTVMAFVMAIAFLLLFFSVRAQILTVQDRVIRLEMRLRLHELLPADLRPRIGDLGVKQLIALRFASDAELPELVREVAIGKLTTPKEIKQRVKEWQGDYLRA